MGRQKGENWFKSVRVWVCLDENGESDCESIELRQKGQDGSSPLKKWKIKDDERDDDAVAKKVNDFLMTAQEDANNQDTQGPFSYFLCGLDDEGSTVQRSNYIKFWNEERDESGLGDEPANPKGLLGQLMRHNEAMMRSMVLQSSKTIESLSGMVAQYQAQEKEQGERRMKLFVELEEAFSERHRRDLEMKQAERREARIDEVSKQLMGFIPALKARLVSSAGGKVSTDASGKKIAEILMPVLDGLTPEQLGQLVAVIGEDKMTALSELSDVLEKVSKTNDVKSAN